MHKLRHTGRKARAGGVAQATEHLPSKPEALSSNPHTEKQTNKQIDKKYYAEEPRTCSGIKMSPEHSLCMVSFSCLPPPLYFHAESLSGDAMR
jgi:hypothetical protein